MQGIKEVWSRFDKEVSIHFGWIDLSLLKSKHLVHEERAIHWVRNLWFTMLTLTMSNLSFLTNVAWLSTANYLVVLPYSEFNSVFLNLFMRPSLPKIPLTRSQSPQSTILPYGKSRGINTFLSINSIFLKQSDHWIPFIHETTDLY